MKRIFVLLLLCSSIATASPYAWMKVFNPFRQSTKDHATIVAERQVENISNEVVNSIYLALRSSLRRGNLEELDRLINGQPKETWVVESTAKQSDVIGESLSELKEYLPQLSNERIVEIFLNLDGLMTKQQEALLLLEEINLRWWMPSKKINDKLKKLSVVFDIERSAEVKYSLDFNLPESFEGGTVLISFLEQIQAFDRRIKQLQNKRWRLRFPWQLMHRQI